MLIKYLADRLGIRGHSASVSAQSVKASCPGPRAPLYFCAEWVLHCEASPFPATEQFL